MIDVPPGIKRMIYEDSDEFKRARARTYKQREDNAQKESKHNARFRRKSKKMLRNRASRRRLALILPLALE